MFSDDMTYCYSPCQNTDCFRHSSHIDWDAPKHRIVGASMADFSQECPNYIDSNYVPKQGE